MDFGLDCEQYAQYAQRSRIISKWLEMLHELRKIVDNAMHVAS